MNKPRADNDIVQPPRAPARRRRHRAAAAAVLALPLAASGLIAGPASAATSHAVTATKPAASTPAMQAAADRWILPPGGRT